MADFRAGAVGAVEQVALHDDAAAHTGTQGDEHHVITALAAALPEFAQGGHVGIVAGLYGEAREPAQFFGYIEDTPAQIDTLIHNALGVDRAGNAQA